MSGWCIIWFIAERSAKLCLDIDKKALGVSLYEMAKGRPDEVWP
jgi:hypothetical protein